MRKTGVLGVQTQQTWLTISQWFALSSTGCKGSWRSFKTGIPSIRLLYLQYLIRPLRLGVLALQTVSESISPYYYIRVREGDIAPRGTMFLHVVPLISQYILYDYQQFASFVLQQCQVSAQAMIVIQLLGVDSKHGLQQLSHIGFDLKCLLGACHMRVMIKKERGMSSCSNWPIIYRYSTYPGKGSLEPIMT